MLYVCLSSEGVDNAMKQLGREKCAELRVDLVKPSMEEMRKLLADKGMSYIVTCRPGVYDEETSIQYLENAAKWGARYIDVEVERGKEVASRLADACAGTECSLIISYHNFDETPPQKELVFIIDKCIQHRADIVKLACRVNTVADNAVLMSLYTMRGNIVAFGMGPLGKIARLASLKCGAAFAYVASDSGEGTAPGQFTVSEMRAALGMVE